MMIAHPQMENVLQLSQNQVSTLVVENPGFFRELLLDYMELVREFDRDKLFVLVGMRSFFTDTEMELFFRTVLAHGYRVLLLDSTDRERSQYEKRLTIDKDLCEF